MKLDNIRARLHRGQNLEPREGDVFQHYHAIRSQPVAPDAKCQGECEGSGGRPSWRDAMTAYPERCGQCNLGYEEMCHHGEAITTEAPPPGQPGWDTYKHWKNPPLRKVEPHEYDGPNKPLLLCDECAQEYHDFWQERWDEYYSSRL